MQKSWAPSHSTLPGTALCLQGAWGQAPARVNAWLDAHLSRFHVPANIPEFLPLTHQHRGHHQLIHDGHTNQQIIPLAPLYVRDLAGRIVLTPLQQLTQPQGPLMPLHCQSIPAEQAEALENVLLLHIRALEFSPQAIRKLDFPAENAYQPLYSNPHLYPYKLRLDTWYIDGFRLPQTELLHVVSAPAEQAQAAQTSFLEKWQQSQAVNESYETFYEKNGAAAWYQALYQQGCTIIPTLEAYNGWYSVNEQFEMTDVTPGRAVPGLHQIIEQQNSPLPPGCILKVMQPGTVVGQHITPAQVVVSNGSHYQAPQGPTPLLPNLSLPHPRAGGGPQDVWLPTHPHHFVQPALFTWHPSAGFIQVSGPLWDPLHYVYASYRPIMAAIRRHVFSAHTPFAAVPTFMKSRFYPITALTWYDVPNHTTARSRSQYVEYHPLAHTGLDMVLQTQPVAQAGYHPMPAVYEVESNPEYFIQCLPQAPGDSPASSPCAPVIVSQVSPQHFQASMVAGPNPHDLQAMQDPSLYTATGSQPPPQQYPQLQRGTPHAALHHMSAIYPFVLGQKTQAELFPNFRRLFGRVGFQQQVSQWHPQLLAWLQSFTEDAAARLRQHYRLQRRHTAALVSGWWHYQSLIEIPEHESTTEEQAIIWACAMAQPSVQSHLALQPPKTGA